MGAGPVGLLLTALLQSMEGYSVHLYEKRREYTRTRMVKIAPYLVADSVASYCTDYIDEETSRPSSIRPSWSLASRFASPSLPT